MQLNPNQEKAVKATGHTVVVACPGSGKTRVLVERAIHLRQLSPSCQIVLVTFTRQAASELRHRLNQRLDSLAGIRVATFHSLALQQLLASSSSKICGPSDQRSLLRLASRPYVDEKHFSDFQRSAEAYTSGHTSGLEKSEYQLAYDAYLELLAEHSAVDFGHAILDAVDLMDANRLPPVPCDHLLVDEVQDIDPTQARWVNAHTDAGAVLTIVGDDDQSVYGFRFALAYRGMRQLQLRHSAQLINLSINYRSHSEILGLAVSLVSHNKHRVPKNLYSAKGPGGSVRLHSRCWSDHDEIEAMIVAVQSRTDKCAIIARTNRKLDLVAAFLRERSIDFTRPGRTQFWELDEPSFFLRLLHPSSLSDQLTMSSLASRTSSPDSSRSNPDDAIRALSSVLHRFPASGPASARINAVTSWLVSNAVPASGPKRDSSIQMFERCRDYLLSMKGDLPSRLSQASRPRSTKEHRIVLLTMHSAKGRQFPFVWILGCQEGTVPSSRSDDLEEERRLLYVSITRAETHLHLSFAWNQIVNRADGSSYLRTLTPSRFLTVDMGLPVPERQDVKHNHS